MAFFTVEIAEWDSIEEDISNGYRYNNNNVLHIEN